MKSSCCVIHKIPSVHPMMTPRASLSSLTIEPSFMQILMGLSPSCAIVPEKFEPALILHEFNLMFKSKWSNEKDTDSKNHFCFHNSP